MAETQSNALHQVILARPGLQWLGALLALAPVQWARRHLFNTPANALLTLGGLWLLWRILPPFVRWSLVDATWSGGPAACRAAGGACWALISQKYRLILFGLYPFEQQWRPLLAVGLILAMLVVTADPRCWRRWLSWMWLAGLAAVAALMWGGVFGLEFVSDERWGGLPLTLLLSVAGIFLSFPFAVVLALGRRSKLPVIRAWCVIYIEVWRGVPLISVLFMASIMFPLFLPEGMTIDKLLRVQLGIVLFTAAYLAENVRGGLQAVSKGQYEAADSIGLSYAQKMRLIVLPQALRMVIPPMVGQFITTFKDTSFVAIIGLYDLLASTKAALADPQWRAFYVEGYVVAALIYFVFSFCMSRYSQFIERRMSRGMRRI